MFASYWFAAVLTEFAQASDWMKWADSIIESSDNPPLWHLELSVATSRTKCLTILSPQKFDEVYNTEGLRGRTINDAALGYLWKRYQRGDYGLHFCLVQAGDIADNYDASLDCESFYQLLTELEKSEETSESLQKIENKAIKMFEPFKLEADKQWDYLQKNRTLT